MSSLRHLIIFNSNSKTINDKAQFHLLQKLAPELRRHIWTMYLRKNRVIHLQFTFKTVEAYCAAIGRKEENNNKKMRGYPYDIYVDPHRPTSKLFQVSRESRAVAQEFYRVHLPCQVPREEYRRSSTSWTQNAEPGVLFLNPEYDFLHVHHSGDVAGWAIGFMQQLKDIHDPRHVGVCNLVVDYQVMAILDPKEAEEKHQNTFRSTISNLKQVLFWEAAPSSRTVRGYMSDLLVPDAYFNRSLPLIPYTSNFEVIGEDPRPIAEDLTRVMFAKHNRNPLETVAEWRRFCQRWGVSPPAASYQVVVGCPAAFGRIYVVDRTSAQEMVEKEDSSWKEDFFYKHAPPEDLYLVPRPAFGFWLFPVEAFGPMTADGLSPDYQAKPDMKADKPKDLTPYWPKLALCDLD